MKKFVIALSLITAFSVASVHADEPRPLAAIMQEMGTEFRSLNQELAASPASAADRSAKLRALAHEAKASSPVAQNRPANLQYLKLITSLELESVKLEAAILAGNAADQTASVTQIRTLMREGHDQFRP